MVLIKVDDVGGERRSVLTYVGNGFLHLLLDEPSPIDRPDSGNCHGDAESLRLLRTKDGQNEFNNPPFSRILAIPKVESVLRVVLSSELPYIQTILAPSPSLTFSWREPVNLRPYLGCPLFRILPHRSKPLIPSLEQEVS